MASMNDPTESDIEMFLDITGLSRADAITRLKANNNDLERATNEYFEDPSGQKYKWDDSQFSMDRQGEANDTGISFNIQGPDELPPTGYQNSGAPTRPPSRANTRSPFGAPTNAAEEDANLKRALAESAAESGIQPQEAGVVDNEPNLKYFGPANRLEYETEQWALVPTKAATEVVEADPPPSMRKRDPMAPAFLRQTKDHRVGFILSIYHKIPLVRNILLQCGLPARNYGHNTEWWKGQPILKQQHLAAMARGEAIWGDDAHPEFTEELHRLMAFLDKTERSYGSVDGLIDTKAIDPSFGGWTPDVEDKLFEAIKEAANSNPECDLDPMTTVGTILPCASPQAETSQLDGDADSYSDEERDTPFIFLEVNLDYEQYAGVTTFYDALDHLLWTHALSLDHPFPEDANYAVLSKAAEVVTVRLSGSGLVKPCEIPAVLYVDRYMKERKDLAIKFQTYMRSIKKQLRLYDLLGASLVRCHGEHCHRVNGLANGPHDLVACLSGIVKQAETLIHGQVKTAQWRHHFSRMENGTELSLDDLFEIQMKSGPCDYLPEEVERMEKWKGVIAGCLEKMKELQTDLANLEDAKEAYRESMRVVTKRLTCQEDEVDDDEFVFRSTSAYHPEYWNPTHKYSLRGVALSKELAYVCVREDANLMDMEGVSEPREQWWKIGYSSSDASPVKTETATLEDVLHAAGTESKFPVLIYASEAAMETGPIPLSDALRMFTRADNRSFQQELSQEQNQGQQQQQQEQQQQQPQQDVRKFGITTENLSYVIAEPYWPKRKHSIGSSVATRGSSRDGLDDVDLTFVEPNQSEDQSPSVTHQEFRDIIPQSKKHGNIESSTNRVTYEDKSFALAPQETFQEMQPDAGFDEMEMEMSKSPEMQERTGGSAPFLTRPGSAEKRPVDMMDIDLDVEHHEG
ncbi:hypothetical protein F4818DRAFT_413401 [Hypoxylon cercidicola]|nr:hypothetical protein F4818DRAFT_413401 [Hypoxylon cercidicola]